MCRHRKTHFGFHLEFCPKITVTESSKNIASDEDVYIDDTNMGSKRIW